MVDIYIVKSIAIEVDEQELVNYVLELYEDFYEKEYYTVLEYWKENYYEIISDRIYELYNDDVIDYDIHNLAHTVYSLLENKIKNE